MPNSAIFDVIARPAGPWRSTKRLDRFAALAMTISLSCQRALGWHPEKNWIRRSSRRMTVILSLFSISLTFASTSHNLYDAKGNVIASCSEKGCEYFIYQGVSRTGVVKNNQFTHQANGLDGKAGEIVRDQTGIKSSELWIPDFHGSVIAKLTKEKSDRILFDAFGGVLNESTNLEDCQDYHYTDKPRIGCTDLHNFNARFYDPKIGRFITTDPIEQHNLNWFAYANNNPLAFVDPDGRQQVPSGASGNPVDDGADLDAVQVIEIHEANVAEQTTLRAQLQNSQEDLARLRARRADMRLELQWRLTVMENMAEAGILPRDPMRLSLERDISLIRRELTNTDGFLIRHIDRIAAIEQRLARVEFSLKMTRVLSRLRLAHIISKVTPWVEAGMIFGSKYYETDSITDAALASAPSFVEGSLPVWMYVASSIVPHLGSMIPTPSGARRLTPAEKAACGRDCILSQ